MPAAAAAAAATGTPEWGGAEAEE
uniref:Uncharacterized protein n=1 Tax=Arundo donax TaxID=35708 RepID=A0A0A9FJS1_ARUDO